MNEHYAVRYYHYGVSHDKCYGYRNFDELEAAIAFCKELDNRDIESFDIALVTPITSICISDKYCPYTTRCRKCNFKRESVYYG